MITQDELVAKVDVNKIFGDVKLNHAFDLAEANTDNLKYVLGLLLGLAEVIECQGEEIKQLRKDLDREVDFTAMMTKQMMEMARQIEFLYEEQDNQEGVECDD